MTYQDPRGPRPAQQYPGGPYGPPQWGQPQPGPGWQRPTPPTGRRARRIAVTVIVIVVLGAAAGGFWLWTRDGGGDPAGPATQAAKDYEAGLESVGAAEVVWQVEQGLAQEAVGVDDHWVTDEHLVRRLPGRVVAYELTTGKEAWELPVGKISDHRCPSSLEHSSMRVALLVASGDGTALTCETLTVVDIGTGKEVFTTELPPIGTQKVGMQVPVVFGETVVLAGPAGARVLDIDDGAVRSMPDPDNPCQSRTAALFGELLLANALCVENGEETNRLRAFDANLDLVWEWVTPKGADGESLPVLGVLSLDPLVVELGHFGKDVQLMRVDPTSGDTVRLGDYDVDDKYLPACDGWALRSCHLARVTGDKVVVTTVLVQVNPESPDAAPGQRSTEFRNELVAFELSTGKEAWRTGMVAGRALSLVPTEDNSLAAYQPENPNGTKGILFSVDAGTGDLAPLMPIGPKAHANAALNDHVRAFNFDSANQQAVLRDGLFIVFKSVHRDSTTGNADTVAFGLPK